MRIVTGAVIILGVSLSACGKKKSATSTDQGNGVNSNGGGVGASVTNKVAGQALNMAGELVLAPTLVDANAPDTVLAFKLHNGAPTSPADIIKAAVDPTAQTFSIDLPKSDSLTALRAARNDDGTIDANKLSQASVGVPPGATQAQLQTLWQTQMNAQEKGGGDTYVLVSMKSQGGDKVAEAKTFTFIGLPIGKNNLINVPVNRANESKIDMGNITTSGDDATASVQASATLFSLDNAAIAELAATDAALKSVKNFYMNGKADAMFVNEVSFTWNGKASAAKNAFSPPDTGLSYLGYGLDLKTFNIPAITVDNLCHDGDATVHKVLTLTPPGDIVSALYNGTPSTHFNPTSPLTNAGTDAITTEGDGTRVCNQALANQGKGGTFGARTNGARGLEMGWGGGGGGFIGAVPAGFWPLVFDGATVGTFDFSAGQAIDSAGHPVVYVPSMNITVDPATNAITKLQVKFYLYDKGTGAYDEVTDMTAFDRSVTSVTIAFTDLSGDAASKNARIYDQWNTDSDGVQNAVLARSGNIYAPDLTKATQGTWQFSDDASTTTPVAEVVIVSYNLYGMQYSFELRNQ